MSRPRGYCTFRLGPHLFGIDVEWVQEVVPFERITRAPLAPPVVAGLMNLRGQIVTAIDLRRRLELGDRPAEVEPLNVVLVSRWGAVSLLVDEISDVVDVDEDELEKPPETLTGVGRDLIRGAFKLESGLLMVLELERVLEIVTEAVR